MSELALSVDGLGKRYRVGARVARADTLAAMLAAAAAAPLRNLRRLRRLVTFGAGEEHDVVWAIRDVSFELTHGEVLGVIGRNGAGKSTLLKILSRITCPSAGRARVFGRIGSLLEVGTGFHPELTGRENVYLNGSILGMDRAYVSRRFEEIVDFAGVARFIDTPVKRYSSGMYLRLAFAVAAHLEPDILIVDEVLAVGDAEFQQKCLGRMDQTAHEGRTVLFVSHNMNAIRRLCRRSLLLERGRCVADGSTADVIEQYLAGAGDAAAPGRWIDLAPAKREGSGAARFTAVRYTSPGQPASCRPRPGGSLEVELRVQAEDTLPGTSMAVYLLDQYGTKLINADTDTIGAGRTLRGGESAWRFHFPQVSLKPGLYQLGLWLADPTGTAYDHIDPAFRFEMADPQDQAIGIRVDRRHDGVVLCDFAVTEVGNDLGEPVDTAGRPVPLLLG